MSRSHIFTNRTQQYNRNSKSRNLELTYYTSETTFNSISNSTIILNR